MSPNVQSRNTTPETGSRTADPKSARTTGKARRMEVCIGMITLVPEGSTDFAKEK